MWSSFLFLFLVNAVYRFSFMPLLLLYWPGLCDTVCLITTAKHLLWTATSRYVCRLWWWGTSTQDCNGAVRLLSTATPRYIYCCAGQYAELLTINANPTDCCFIQMFINTVNCNWQSTSIQYIFKVDVTTTFSLVRYQLQILVLFQGSITKYKSCYDKPKIQNTNTAMTAQILILWSNTVMLNYPLHIC